MLATSQFISKVQLLTKSRYIQLPLHHFHLDIQSIYEIQHTQTWTPDLSPKPVLPTPLLTSLHGNSSFSLPVVGVKSPWSHSWFFFHSPLTFNPQQEILVFCFNVYPEPNTFTSFTASIVVLSPWDGKSLLTLATSLNIFNKSILKSSDENCIRLDQVQMNMTDDVCSKPLPHEVWTHLLHLLIFSSCPFLPLLPFLLNGM